MRLAFQTGHFDTFDKLLLSQDEENDDGQVGQYRSRHQQGPVNVMFILQCGKTYLQGTIAIRTDHDQSPLELIPGPLEGHQPQCGHDRFGIGQ